MVWYLLRRRRRRSRHADFLEDQASRIEIVGSGFTGSHRGWLGKDAGACHSTLLEAVLTNAPPIEFEFITVILRQHRFTVASARSIYIERNVRIGDCKREQKRQQESSNRTEHHGWMTIQRVLLFEWLSRTVINREKEVMQQLYPSEEGFEEEEFCFCL